jgi:hypothetical protein
MQVTPLKAIVAALWLLAVAALGAFLPVTSIKGWLPIVGFGLMPGIFMLRAWRQPSQTMSESIREHTRK